MKQLTLKQKRFIDEYLLDLNATAAARRAGYRNPNKGRQLVTKSNTSKAISMAMEERSRRTEIKQDQVVRELARLAFFNICDVISWDDKGVYLRSSSEIDENVMAGIADIKIYQSKRDEEVILVSIKSQNKIKALVSLGKHLGLFK